MSGRFPGANNIRTFWENLISGRETIAHFPDSELEHDVADSSARAQGMRFVNARGVLENVDLLDADFFDIYPREAELIDPQHRLFLECAWEAVESAGYDPEKYDGLVGIYAGLSLNSYLLANLVKDRRFALEFAGQYQVGAYHLMLGNEKDFMPLRVAYKLNLRGPVLSVQSACSTSLVAVCQAAQSLLNYQCDMALAGGSSITFPQKRNYLYQDEAMVSGDGHIHVFDARAQGTVFGHGVGVVLLKRLKEAIADGDPIAAVIRGFAVNNDGSVKVGFAAPSVNGQAEVIATAQAMAGIHPDTVSYIEAHGTGTPLGDPIEIAALTQAFRAGGSQRSGFCSIGSVKPNIGHLEVAAGVAGMIKTVLSLQHKKIPPILHFEKPNPKIDFDNSPFYPVTSLIDWNVAEGPRRAGVSAFGVGGTNAHIVLEEAPIQGSEPAARSEQLFLLSARTATALDAATANLAQHLRVEETVNPADVTYTLQVGRRVFSQRRFFVSQDRSEALRLLSSPYPPAVTGTNSTNRETSVGFLFPGQGAQRVNMGRGLYQSEEVYRSAIDRCAHILKPHIGLDLRDKLYPSPGGECHGAQITEPVLAQPLTFAVEYALSQLWMSWGLIPSVLLGYSIGEYVAAVIAEVFSLEDTLSLLAVRARLMQDIPKGSMMVAFLPASKIEPDLPEGVSVAAENGSAHTVVSGPDPQIRALEEELNSKNVATRYVLTSHAFHSSMMDPILDEFTRKASKVTPRSPRIPWVSTYTGRRITKEDLLDPAYWSGQLRHRVKFADALDHLMEFGSKVLLEAGPGQTLTGLARQQWGRESDVVVAASLPNPEDWKTDVRSILQAAGRLWTAGLDLDWKAFHRKRFRKRVSLPTYPFERKRFWIEPPVDDALRMASGAAAEPGLATQTLTPAPAVTQITSEQASPTAPAQQQDRRAHLVLVLQDLITELSGLDSSGIEESASFVELGFDSLLLTQFSTACQSRFGVKITFRQMFCDLSSVSALADYLNQQLPADGWHPQASPLQDSKTPAQLDTAAASSIPAQSQGPVVATEGLSPTTLDQIIAQQHQVIRQLEALKTQGGLQKDLPEPIGPNTVRLNERTRPKNFDSQHKTFGCFRAVQVERVEDWEPNQRKALEDLTMRYTQKTAGSKKYTEEHRSHFADPRAVAGFKLDWKEMVYPIVASKSRGSRVWDLDGNEYIDITMGFGSVFFGHSPDWITKELHQQLELGVEIGPQSCLAGEVAGLICEFTGMDRVTFCNTGSEAVMASLRLARTVTGREKVVMFKGSYHGTFDEILTRPVIVKDELRTLPIAPGVTPNLIQNMIVLDYGTPESLELIGEQAGSLAAVLVEPVQSRHPENQPRQFLHEIRRITRESGTALIFDEVVTGFRCHPGGAQAWFGVEADIATYGKVVGGGMPIGFIAGRRKWMDPLDGGKWHFGDDSFPEIGVTFFAGTFVRHPLAMAAAYTALRFLKEKGPSLQECLNRRVETLVDRLNAHFQYVGAPLKLLHFSSFFVIEYPPDLYTASLLWYYLREKGIHVWEGFPCYFTLAHSESDMDRVARAFEESVAEMQAVGLLPTGDKCWVSRLDSEPDSIENENHLKRVPVTDAQQEMWFATQISDEASSAFNESMAVYFRGNLQWDAFERALREVVTRHEALRSVFSPDGSLSLVRPEIHLEIPVHDLRQWSPEQRDYELAALRDAEGRRVFDLSTGPLLAMQMVFLSAQESVLLFTAHHIACDSWSYAVVLRELSVLYTSYVRGEIPRLGEPTQMSQYVKWERDLKVSPVYARHEQFWVSQYRSIPPPIDLPFAAPRPAIRSFDGARQIHIMSSELTQSLREFGRRVGTTLFSVLLAGFQSLLHRLTGLSDIVIGIPYAGQNSLGAEDLVGHYANTLPLRVSFPADISFADFVRLSRDRVLDAYEHRDYTFGSLIQKLRMPRDPSRVPIVSVIFNFEPPWEDIDFAGLTHRMELNPRHYFQFDLGLNVVHQEDRLRMECDFNSNLFDTPSIERLLHHYESLLRKATNAPELLVSCLIEKSSGNEIEDKALFIWD
jgi:acyl transferase domain-containing protein/glutamate-1-semialdehyde aminotransferase